MLVASDYFTQWVEAYAILNQEATTVATKLLDDMFCRFGIPDQLHSDQGSQFESEVIQEVSHVLQIQKIRTTPYHPQSDGLLEQFTNTLLSMKTATVRDHPFEWESIFKRSTWPTIPVSTQQQNIHTFSWCMDARRSCQLISSTGRLFQMPRPTHYASSQVHPG